MPRSIVGPAAAVLLAAAAVACSTGLDASVHVTGTIRAPDSSEAACTMVYANERGHILATHRVSGDFDVALPVSRAPRTYRFEFRCEGYEDVNTALTLHALPQGEKASLGTIALGPKREGS